MKAKMVYFKRQSTEMSRYLTYKFLLNFWHSKHAFGFNVILGID